MDKLDFKKADRAYYSGKQGRWDRLQIPEMTYLMIDGQGAPYGPVYAAALAALYPLAYVLKFAAKAQGADFVVPPLEGLWWSDDLDAFVKDERDKWQWTMMIRMPEGTTCEQLDASRASTCAKLTKKKSPIPEALDMVRLEAYEAGDCFQMLHLGSYADEAPHLAYLHDELMPQNALTFNGHHQEIYLSDPRRVAPEKLKTILRQPVKPL